MIAEVLSTRSRTLNPETAADILGYVYQNRFNGNRVSYCEWLPNYKVVIVSINPVTGRKNSVVATASFLGPCMKTE